MENLLCFVGIVIVMALVLALLRSLWIGLAMRAFGWKPRILDEKVMMTTIQSCTSQFLEKCLNLRRDQAEGMSEQEARMMQEDVANYTKFVIESYVTNYLVAR